MDFPLRLILDQPAYVIIYKIRTCNNVQRLRVKVVWIRNRCGEVFCRNLARQIPYGISLTDPAFHPSTWWRFDDIRRVHSNVQAQHQCNTHCFHLQFNKITLVKCTRTWQRVRFISHQHECWLVTHFLFHSPRLRHRSRSFDQLLMPFLHETKWQLPVYYLPFVLIAEQIVEFCIVNWHLGSLSLLYRRT